MRGDEAERARLLEAEARIVRGNASTMTAGSPASSARPSAPRISRTPTPMRWRSGRTDIGVRLRILVQDPPSTPTQLSIT
jgi:hypothetical protein